jgi:hypothetical protein
MPASAKVVRDSGVLMLRYAVIFGGIISLVLLTTNAQKTMHGRHSSYSALAQISP